MALIQPPIYMQSGTYGAAHDRFNLWVPLDMPGRLNLQGNSAYPQFPHAGGVFVNLNGTAAQMNNHLEVTKVSGLLFRINGGSVAVDATSVAGANMPGTYVGHNSSSAVQVSLDSHSPSNPRIDIIYAGFRDQVDGGASSQFVIGVLKGNPSSNPVAKVDAVIGDVKWWIPLAGIRVPAGSGATADPKDLRQWVTGRGGVRYAQDSDYFGGEPNYGDLRYNRSTKNLAVWLGGQRDGQDTNWERIATEEWVNYNRKEDNTKYRIASNQQNQLKRTKSAGFDATPQGSTGAEDGDWSAVTKEALSTPEFQTPTGKAVVSLSGLMYHANGGTNNWNACIMGVRIYRPGSGAFVYESSNSDAAIYPHGPQLKRGTASWTGIVTGLPVDTDLIAHMVFKNDNTADWAYFSNTNIVVQPVR
jgi:hypothetical protein